MKQNSSPKALLPGASGRKETVEITDRMLDDFFHYLEICRRSAGTRELYEYSLRKLLDYLPERRRLSRELFLGWIGDLSAEGYAARTVNARISAVNSFLKFIGHRELQIPLLNLPAEGIQPELTRAEYLRLLNAAKLQGDERTYLIIKTICCVGARVQDIPKITVKMLEEDRVPCRHADRDLRFPQMLRKELFLFARRRGITEGPVFVTKQGGPINRTSINNSLKKLSGDAQVEESKCSPSCLLRLYQRTCEEIENSIAVLIEQAYDRILQQEEHTCGWDGEETKIFSFPSAEKSRRKGRRDRT